MEEDIAPTDSRLRPDQRLMEEGRLCYQRFKGLKMQAQFQMGRGEQGEGAIGGEAEGSEKAEGARGGTCCPGSYLCGFSMHNLFWIKLCILSGGADYRPNRASLVQTCTGSLQWGQNDPRIQRCGISSFG